MDECVQLADRDRRLWAFENSLHEAEVVRAHDLSLALGDVEEWTVPQADLRLFPGLATLGRKPELVEHADEVVD